MMTRIGKVLSVNVGRPREFDYHGRSAKSAIWKSPVGGRVAARGVNLDGDDQADRKAHGGPHKALYAYATEDSSWWEQQLGRSISFGEFGENLTLEGVDVNGARIGERWQVGTTLLEVSEPRIPCWRLGVRMNDDHFPARFTEAMRPGTYLRIIAEGEVGADDEVTRASLPEHDLSVRDVFRIYTRDRNEVERLLAVHQLSERWHSWAARLLHSESVKQQ